MDNQTSLSVVTLPGVNTFLKLEGQRQIFAASNPDQQAAAKTNLTFLNQSFIRFGTAETARNNNGTNYHATGATTTLFGGPTLSTEAKAFQFITDDDEIFHVYFPNNDAGPGPAWDADGLRRHCLNTLLSGSAAGSAFEDPIFFEAELEEETPTLSFGKVVAQTGAPTGAIPIVAQFADEGQVPLGVFLCGITGSLTLTSGNIGIFMRQGYLPINFGAIPSIGDDIFVNSFGTLVLSSGDVVGSVLKPQSTTTPGADTAGFTGCYLNFNFTS